MTANDYMRMAAQCAEMSKAIASNNGDPHKDFLGLTRYHLLSAAANLRRLGEAQAARDRAAAAEGKTP